MKCYCYRNDGKTCSVCLKRTKESDIRKALDERVKAYGGETRAAAWLGRKHCPDVFVMFPGEEPYTVWVETKMPMKKATAGQAREHARMHAAGCIVLVITTIEELDKWLPPLK